MFTGSMHMIKYAIVIYRIHETILILISLKCYFSYHKKSILNLSRLLCVCEGGGGGGLVSKYFTIVQEIVWLF